MGVMQAVGGLQRIMNNLAYFWAAAGFMAGIAAAFFVMRLLGVGTGSAATATDRRDRVALIAAGAFVVLAFVVYAWVGTPAVVTQATAVSAHASTAQSATSNGEAAGSMIDAINKLVAKLAAGTGSDADWQLLQQSYQFLGDTQAAELAQQHQLKPDAAANAVAAPVAASVATTDDQTALPMYQQLVSANPKDAASWLAIAQLQRTARNFAAANTAFEKVIALRAMTADAWADYADVAASQTGTLANAATRKALDAALQLQAGHAKALWLKASLAHEEHRYGDALKVWQQLRGVIPDSSPDINIIDANIAEARSLAGSTGKPVANRAAVTQTAQQTAQQVAQVRGSVVLGTAFKQQIKAGMTLFVYAKAPDAAAPVAAYRVVVNQWPVSFVLDDALAMMPTRKLSQFARVTIEARLSRSGQALAQSGDLQAAPVTVATQGAEPVTLQLNQQVP